MNGLKNLQPGTIVPMSGTYRCFWCGKGGIADGLADQSDDINIKAQFKMIANKRFEKYYEAGQVFTECPNCGPPTGWTFLSDGFSSDEENTLRNVKSKAGNVIEKLIGERPKEGCFIATATMGDYGHPAVLTLREFRDEYLEKRKWGRAFTRLYYKHAPFFARIIEKRSALSRASYLLIIMPLVAVSKRLLKKEHS